MDEAAENGEIRVMHVEDHAGFRVLVKNLLNSQSDMEVVAQAASLDEARTRVESSAIDVAVLDLSLPDGNGLDLIPELRRANPDVGVLVLSANLDPAGPERAPGSGADEILDKLAPIETFLDSVRKLGVRNLERSDAGLGDGPELRSRTTNSESGSRNQRRTTNRFQLPNS